MPDSGAGTLFVCAVPIGNLEDASPRLRRVLSEVDVIACEDTRTTGRLLQLLGVERSGRLLAHHAHNEHASAAGLVELLLAGEDVALVSDAGSPGVSDPGAAAALAAHAASIEVVAVAGPSAVAAALGVAGASAPDGGYRFVGFLPRSAQQVAALVERHAGDLLVAFESPRRLGSSLAAIAGVQPERYGTVCRELTKRHEQVDRAPVGALADRYGDDVRGEVVLVLDPQAVVIEQHPRALELVLAIEAAGVRLKDATRIIAEHLGGSARELYDCAHARRAESD